MMQDYLDAVHSQGFAVVERVLDETTVERLRACLEAATGSSAIRRRGSSTYGIRNLLNLVPAVADLARQPGVRSLVEPILGCGARVVRGIFFDKTSDANWKVPWHQDLTIAVRHRIDVAGFEEWSIKAGIVHVVPPTAVLEQMLAIRLHLDHTPAANGALQVIPGSHRFGRLKMSEVQRMADECPAVVCPTLKGAALAMRPLLLHSSSTCTTPTHRRVIHLEFAAHELPRGLEWFGS